MRPRRRSTLPRISLSQLSSPHGRPAPATFWSGSAECEGPAAGSPRCPGARLPWRPDRPGPATRPPRSVPRSARGTASASGPPSRELRQKQLLLLGILEASEILSRFLAANSYPRLAERLPRQARTYPRLTERSPRQAQTYPRLAESLPRQAKIYPRLAESLPRQAQTYPRLTERSPRQAQIYPRLAERLPRLAQIYPRSTERLPCLAESSIKAP